MTVETKQWAFVATFQTKAVFPSYTLPRTSTTGENTTILILSACGSMQLSNFVRISKMTSPETSLTASPNLQERSGAGERKCSNECKLKFRLFNVAVSTPVSISYYPITSFSHRKLLWLEFDYHQSKRAMLQIPLSCVLTILRAVPVLMLRR